MPTINQTQHLPNKHMLIYPHMTHTHSYSIIKHSYTAHLKKKGLCVVIVWLTHSAWPDLNMSCYKHTKTMRLKHYVLEPAMLQFRTNTRTIAPLVEMWVGEASSLAICGQNHVKEYRAIKHTGAKHWKSYSTEQHLWMSFINNSVNATFNYKISYYVLRKNIYI